MISAIVKELKGIPQGTIITTDHPPSTFRSKLMLDFLKGMGAEEALGIAEGVSQWFSNYTADVCEYIKSNGKNINT